MIFKFFFTYLLDFECHSRKGVGRVRFSIPLNVEHGSGSPRNISVDIYTTHTYSDKVEKIFKGSLDLIPSPSPSVKIQIMGRKVCLRWKGKTLLGVVNKLLFQKSFDNTHQYFAFTPQTTFPTHNLKSNWRWRWCDWTPATFKNLFYFIWNIWQIMLHSSHCHVKFPFKSFDKMSNKKYYLKIINLYSYQQRIQYTQWNNTQR